MDKEFIGRHEALSVNVAGLLASIHDLRFIFSEQQKEIKALHESMAKKPAYRR